MLECVFSREAERDLEAIEDYTATHWGDKKAARYIRAIFKACETLKNYPEKGHARADIPQPYKVYAVESHVIIYRHHARKKRIEILNILHPAMNIEERLMQALTNTSGH